MQLIAVKLAVEKVHEMPLLPAEAPNTVILGEYSGRKEGDTLSDHRYEAITRGREDTALE